MGFQDSALTEFSAPAIGTVPKVAPSAASSSGAAQILGGLTQLGGMLTKALPQIERNQNLEKVEGYVKEYQTLSELRAQSTSTSNSMLANGKQKEWELSLERENPAVAATVKSQLGIKDLNEAEKRETISQNELAYEQTGNLISASTATPEQKYNAGKSFVTAQRQTALKLASLKTAKEIGELEDAEQVREFGNTFSVEADAVSSGIISTFGSVFSKVDLNTTGGQQILNDHLVKLKGLRDGLSQQYTMSLRTKGANSSVQKKVVTEALSGIDNVIGMFENKNKYVREIAKDYLAFYADNTRIQLSKSTNTLAQLVALGDPKALSELIKLEATSKNMTEFRGILKSLLTNEPSKISSSKEDSPEQVVVAVLESSKNPEATQNIVSPKANFDMAIGLKAIIKNSYHKSDVPTTTDDATAYSNTFSNLLKTVKGMEKYTNQVKMLGDTYLDVKRPGIMKLLPPAQRKALDAKVGEVTGAIARRAIRSLGDNRGILSYNSSSGTVTVDKKVMASITQPLTEKQSSMIGGASKALTTLFSGSSDEAKLAEAKTAQTAADAINTSKDIFIETARSDPRLVNFTDTELGYLYMVSVKGNQVGLVITEPLNLEDKLPSGSDGKPVVTQEQILSELSTEIEQATTTAYTGVQTDTSTVDTSSLEPPVSEGDEITPAPRDDSEITTEKLPDILNANEFDRIPDVNESRIIPTNVPKGFDKTVTETLNTERVKSNKVSLTGERIEDGDVPTGNKTRIEESNDTKVSMDTVGKENKRLTKMYMDGGQNTQELIARLEVGDEGSARNLINDMWMPYKDNSPSGEAIPTIGYGNQLSAENVRTGTVNIKGVMVDWTKGITRQQALDLLETKVVEYEKAARASLAEANLVNPKMDAALTSLIYNVGVYAWDQSNAKKALESGDIDTFLEEAFGKKGWIKVTKIGTKQKIISNGLVNRRNGEKDLFMEGYNESPLGSGGRV